MAGSARHDVMSAVCEPPPKAIPEAMYCLGSLIERSFEKLAKAPPPPAGWVTAIGVLLGPPFTAVAI